MHTETYIADDNATLISKSFRDLKKYLDMVSYGQISIPYLTRFKKVIINNARSDFCVDEVKSLLSRGILQDAEAVEIKNPDDRFCTIDGMLYSGNKQKLYLCPRGKTGNLVIHDGAELICDYACAWVRCDQVTIPDSVKSIGENAFAFNLNLKKVEGGRNIQNIKPFAFYRCYRLKRFEFGEKLKIIGSSAFDYASLNEMKEIKFSNGIKTIGGGAFNTIDIIEDKPDMSPFYGVVKEAYKENGKNLAVMMDIGRLNKDTAEELFVKSVSYIQTQDKLKQDELYEAFASGLQDAIADPNISFETKQVLTGFVINYEFDNYKDKIQENIEKGCRWDDIVKHQEMQLTPEEHEQLTKMAEKIGADIANDMPAGTKEDLTKELQNRMTKFRTENPHLTRKQFAGYIESANDSMTRQIEALQKEAQKTQKTPEKATMKPDNTAMANKREQRIELGEAMKEARGMAMDAIKDMKDQKKYAPVIGKMMTQISEISDKYQRLDNKQIRWVQEAAIASFTTHASDTMIDAFNAEAAKSGNAVFKKFSEDRGRKLRVSSLLNAASKVNISDRLTGKKNEFNEFRQDLSDTMDVDISCKMDPPDQEKFLSDVANHIFKAEKTQLIYLSEEARKYGLKLEASEHLRDNKQIDEQCRVLVKQYENSITNPNPYFKPRKNLMAFADFTVTTKDMEGSERFLTALRKEVDKISDKDMKEKVSAAVENDIGLYKDELNNRLWSWAGGFQRGCGAFQALSLRRSCMR